MNPSLPLEILELIVDCLALEDIKVLSLVCSTLLPRCRMHLFETISVFSCYGVDRTAIGLWELLRGTPELCPYVHTIIYHINDEPVMGVWTPAVSQRLTKLESLHLHGHESYYRSTTWETTPHRPALLSLLRPTLTHLKLNLLNDFPLSDLIPCVGLKHLEISWINFKDSPVDLTALLEPIVIDRFTMVEQDPGSLRSILSAQPSNGKPFIGLTTIKTLYVRFIPFQDFRESVDVLGGTQHLVELELDLSNVRRFPLDGLCDILVGSLETLKRLKFHLYVPGHRDSEDQISGLSRELEKLRYQNVIERVTISIGPLFDLAFDDVDKLGTLDHTLSGLGWPALECVSLVFKVHEKPPENEVVLELRETQFMRLMSSPTVRFEFKVE